MTIFIQHFYTFSPTIYNVGRSLFIQVVAVENASTQKLAIPGIATSPPQQSFCPKVRTSQTPCKKTNKSSTFMAFNDVVLQMAAVLYDRLPP
jgi:hypothetical protein